jgi:hypothetical protein
MRLLGVHRVFQERVCSPKVSVPPTSLPAPNSSRTVPIFEIMARTVSGGGLGGLCNGTLRP